MSEIIKPKKERKFLKALGKIGEVLIQDLFFRVGSNLIRKIGGKKPLPSILFIFLSLSLFAQFPNTLNKQRLGFQTTADGLVWRGSISDTASIQPVNNQNAWVILDTINLKFYTFDFTSNVWNLVGGAQGLTMPFDSITFNTAKNGTVGVGEVEYSDTQGSLIQGLKGNVTNVIGQQLHQRVNNRTGATLNKGDVVYLAGSQGNRITVAKGLAVTDAFSANTFGVVAESIPDNQSGFIITEGLITGLNTSALTEDSAVYLSPTVAGALTSTKPQAPQHSVYIGVCVKSNNGSGELFVKIRNGQELDELHDVRITSPVDRASLYYKNSEKLWRDTTAALLVSDTASMLANYATKAYADTTGRLYARQDFTNVSSSTLTWTQSDTLIPGGVTVVQVYRNGQILLPSQYTIPTSTSVVISASSFKVNDNYTVIFPRGGGAGSGGGSGSLTSISAGTGITVSPNPITTTGTVSADLSVLMELTDTSLLNLTSRFNTKQNTLVSGTNIKTVNSNSLLGSGNISVGTLVASDTVSLSNRINTKLNSTDTTSLSNRINLKLNATDTASLSNRINAKGTGTVTSVATGYGLTGGAITSTGTLLLDSAVVFSRIRDSIVDVAIGNDTIKILKQEYAPATTSVLTWTVTPKFPIQSKLFILVFRNGQLLINDQYNLTDTNKITIVSNSFKVGANYTVVTVSGIGSVGTGVFPNPVYPEAGIAVSTGSAWASSIANNSSNWNVAFNDKITNAQFTGTNTKTLTLTQYDGGTFTPTFTDLQGVTGVTAGTGLTGGTITSTGTVAVDFTTVAPLANPTFTGTVSGITKSMVGLGNVDNTSDANKPVSTATQTALNLKVNIIDTASMLTPYFRDADTTQLNLTSRFATKLNLSDTASMLTPYFRDADTTSLNLTSRFAEKQNTLVSGNNIKTVNSNNLLGSGNISVGTVTSISVGAGTPMSIANNTTTPEISMPAASQTTDGFLRATAFALFESKQSTISLTTTGNSGAATFFNNSLNIPNYTLSGLGGVPTTRTISINGTTQDLIANRTFSVGTLVANDTVSLSNRINLKFNTADTTQLNLTSRFNTKQNTISGTGFVKANGTSITYDNSSYLRTGLADSTYLKLTGGTLTGNLYTKYLNTFAKTTYVPFNAGIGEQSIFNVGTALRGGTVMVFPDSNLVGSSANIFLANSSVQGVEYSAMGSGMRNYAKQGGDTRRNSLAFYTSGIGSQNTNRLFIDFDGNVGINDDTPSFKLDVNGTLNATGATTIGSTLAVTGNITEAGNNVLTNLDTVSLSNRIDSKFNSSGGTISGAVTLSTTTATPSSLLGKSTGNVVGNVRLTSPLSLAGDSLNLGTVPISKGGTGADNASLARTLLSVGYDFAQVTAGSSVTITSNRVSIVNTGGFSTTQLDLTPATNGRMYMIKNLATGTVVSLHSNVIPFAGGSPTTAILSAGNVTPQWVTLVADGTNWHMIQKN